MEGRVPVESSESLESCHSCLAIIGGHPPGNFRGQLRRASDKSKGDGKRPRGPRGYTGTG